MKAVFQRMKENNMPIVLVISAIYLATWFCASTTSNVVQLQTITQKAAGTLFPSLRHLGTSLYILLIFMVFTKTFQKMLFQRNLMIVILLSLMGALALSVNHLTYPVISSLSNFALNLCEGWRQFFVPPALRTTLEGLMIGLGILLDVRAINIQNAWMNNLTHFNRLIYLFIVLIILFWYVTRNIPAKPTNTKTMISTYSFRQLICNYHYIFIFCFFVGFNEGVFGLLLRFSDTLLPNRPPEYYQLTSCFGGFIGAMVLGYLASKTGIYIMFIIASIGFITCHMIDIVLILSHSPYPFVYYVTMFLQSGFILANSALVVSLIGERLSQHGIFRAMGIANLVGALGSMFNMRVGIMHYDSLARYKLVICVIDILFLSIISYLMRAHIKRPLDYR